MFGIVAQTQEWWVSAVTGSGGALVVLGWLVKTQHQTIDKKDDLIASKDNEILELTRESLTAITKSLERGEADQQWKDEMKQLVMKVLSHIDKINTTTKNQADQT